MAQILVPAPWRATDANGDPVPGAQAYFYISGTDTLQPVYTDEAGTTAAASPLLADSAGIFAPIFNTSANLIEADVRNPVTGASLPGYPVEIVPAPTTSTSGASAVTFAPTVAIPQTNVQAAIQQVQTNAEAIEARTLRNVLNKAATFTVALAERANLFNVTATATMNLPTAATAGDGFFAFVQANGADVTIDPNGSETINGAATLLLNAGESAQIMSNGALWYAHVVSGPLDQPTWDAGTDTQEARISPAKLAATITAQAGLVTRALQATTSGTEFDFTSIPADAKEIIVAFNGVDLSGSNQILVQLGDVDGFETAGYVSGSAVSGNNEGSTSGFVIQSSGEAFHGQMHLTLMDAATFLWVASHGGVRGTNVSVFGGGRKALSAALTQVRVTRSGTDTFAAGSVNISVR